MDVDASIRKDLANAEGLVLDGYLSPGAVAREDQVVRGWTANEGHVDSCSRVDGLTLEDRGGIGSGGQEKSKSGLVVVREHLDGLVLVASNLRR